MTEPSCPFCSPGVDSLFHAGDSVLGIWDKFPVSPGHALIVTRRHVASWFEANLEERAELMGAVLNAQAAIEKRHRPDGYNIGINIGAAAGQTIFHLHLHVIPRYAGDVEDPRGGVRHVIPAKGNYAAEPSVAYGSSVRGPGQLVTGGSDPLLPHIRANLDRAHQADFAVAFVMDSGFLQIEAHLMDFLARGGRLRFLTGDYLCITDPNALLRLLDLEGDIHRRVFVSSGKSFHPKAYIFHDGEGIGTAFVGSSNLSETALGSGVEWNYRVISSRDKSGFADVVTSFGQLFGSPSTADLTPEWVARYRQRREAVATPRIEIPPEPPLPPPEPHEVQKEALRALEQTRVAGNQAGLVVLATGLGKTWLSAFDSARREFKRVLFVAHREEILAQARATFRRIRPTATLGHYMGADRQPDADVLFASIQTLGRANHLRTFDPNSFDYIVVDEFHHAAAGTYRRLIEYFRPKFLLGLTATPERTDGGDLLALCQENLVFRLDFAEGIRRGLLSPFGYFGVPDEVDYSNIPWRSNRFDEEALTNAVATQARAQNSLEQYRLRAGLRTLGFCCSVRHADFMADFFRQAGVRAVAVHSAPTSAARATSLEHLANGELDVVFAVDVFNEGLDLPEIDTVMMLRPTESRIVWLQQFGRGLRKVEGKNRLTVIDYIGNHRAFLLKPMTLLAQTTDGGLARALEQVIAGEFELPPGCEVTYNLKAIDLIRGLLRIKLPGVESLQLFYEDFREREGIRPTASEAFHVGFNPRVARKAYGSWLRFVEHMGGLESDQIAALAQFGDFLDSLETTPMTKSYKMLILQAMLNRDVFPGEMPIELLTDEITALVSRSAALREDVGPALMQPAEMRQLVEKNPVNAWTGGQGTGGVPYFAYKDGTFRFISNVSDEQRGALQELTREIVDWRLAEYLSRAPVEEAVICKVSHTAGETPIIFLPTDDRRNSLPDGWTEIAIGAQRYQANFVKIALNVVRQPGSDKNQLPEILRSWFGPDAGKSGTVHQVVFDRGPEGYSLAPLVHTSKSDDAELWKSYMRREIPELFGLKFNTGSWQQGLVSTPKQVILLVTLNKSALNRDAKYKDRFESPEIFQWESPNSTTQSSGPAQKLRHHRENGLPVHLFVRPNKLGGSGTAAPFYYCGKLEFLDWEGEKPIAVRWRLERPLPEKLFRLFGLSTK